MCVCSIFRCDDESETRANSRVFSLFVIPLVLDRYRSNGNAKRRVTSRSVRTTLKNNPLNSSAFYNQIEMPVHGER